MATEGYTEVKDKVMGQLILGLTDSMSQVIEDSFGGKNFEQMATAFRILLGLKLCQKNQTLFQPYSKLQRINSTVASEMESYLWKSKDNY